MVLIESQRVSRSPLPVLTRGPADSGVVAQADTTSPTPTLTAAAPPNKQVSARLGEDLTLQGSRLDGSTVMDEVGNVTVASTIAVRFTDLRSGRILEAAPRPGNTANEITVRLADARDPEAPANNAPPEKRWAAGVYNVAVLFERPGEMGRRTTNELPFSLAPRILDRINARRDAGGGITFTVRCEPEIRPEQRVALLVGDLDIPARDHAAQTNTLTFVAGDIPPGNYYVRLRVDGVDSLLVKRPVEPRTPPVFDPSQKVRVP